MEYVPGIHFSHNAYADHDEYNKYLCSANSTFGYPHYYNPPSYPSLTSCVISDTEVIKQTIIRHEAIFRQQVMELHRLYDKQRELMDETGSAFHRQNTQVKLASSEYGWVEQKQSSVSLPVTHGQSLQLEFLTNLCTDGDTHQVKHKSREFELLDTRCKKYNNKVLDLELLATEYMDDDDDDNRFSPKVDAQEKGLSSESASNHLIFFDLNEPYSFEEEVLLKFSDYAAPVAINEDVLFKDLSTKTNKRVGSPSAASHFNKNVHESVANIKDQDNYDGQAILSDSRKAGQKTSSSNPLKQESNPENFSVSSDTPKMKRKNSDEHSSNNQTLRRISKKRTLNSGKSEGCITFSENKAQDLPQLIPVSNKNEAYSKHVFSSVQSMHDFRRNPIVVQALPCTQAAVPMKKKKSNLFLRATGPDKDSNQFPELLRHKPHTNRSLLNPFVRVKKAKRSEKGRKNANSRILNQDSYQLGVYNPRVSMKFRVEYSPKAPQSPENEECSPLRVVESDENLLETASHFYKTKDGNTEADVAVFAARAIVFLSAADAHDNRRSLFGTSLFGPSNPLNWFAEVVSTEDSSIECLLPSGDDDLDHFETMTLKLEDMNSEDQLRPSFAGQDEELPLVTAFPGQVQRARGRRAKKLKDFQGIVLPGISSLSRHEVTEDLHLIEGLMEAAGTPRIFGVKKSNGCARGKKQSSYAAPVAAENSPCLALDHQVKSNELSERRQIKDWGKISKRRRKHRYPARKFTFGQVAQAPIVKHVNLALYG